MAPRHHTARVLPRAYDERSAPANNNIGRECAFLAADGRATNKQMSRITLNAMARARRRGLGRQPRRRARGDPLRAHSFLSWRSFFSTLSKGRARISGFLARSHDIARWSLDHVRSTELRGALKVFPGPVRALKAAPISSHLARRRSRRAVLRPPARQRSS